MEDPNEIESEEVDRKLPYEAPAIEETGRFEHLVLACAKSEGAFCYDYGLTS